MQTYYIHNTSQAVRNHLLVAKWLRENNKEWVDGGAVTDVGAVRLRCEKITVESLADFLATQTSDCIEIYDGEGNIVASTHPVEPTERGNPGPPGEYLCRLERIPIPTTGKKEKCWMVLNWTGAEWLTSPDWKVIRWLYLPRAV